MPAMVNLPLQHSIIDLGQLDDETMKEYSKNKNKCRKEMLLDEVDSPTDCSVDNLNIIIPCACCDIC